MLNWFKKEKQKLHRDYIGEEFNMERLDDHFKELEHEIDITGYTNFWEEMQAQHMLMRADLEPYLQQPFPQLLWLAVSHIGDYPEGFMKDKIYRSMFTREIQSFLDDNYRGDKTENYDDNGYAARFVFNDMRDDLYHIISRHEMRDLNKTLDELAEQTKGAKASAKEVTAVYPTETMSDEDKKKVMEEWKKEPLKLTPVSTPKVELAGGEAIRIINDLYNTAVTLGVPDIEDLCVKDFLLLLESGENTILTEAVHQMKYPEPSEEERVQLKSLKSVPVDIIKNPLSPIVADTIVGTMNPLPVPGLKENTPGWDMKFNDIGEKVETKASGAKQNYVEEAFELVPYPVISAIASTMKEGLEKYGYQNYYGIPMEEHMGRAIRHMFKHLSGDTSENHLGHAITRLGFAIEMKDIAEKNGGYELFAHLKKSDKDSDGEQLTVHFPLELSREQKASVDKLSSEIHKLAGCRSVGGKLISIDYKLLMADNGEILQTTRQIRESDGSEYPTHVEDDDSQPTAWDLNNPDEMQKMRNQSVGEIQ